ncbi:MAG: sensor histidine kinase [Bacteroidota bacterium]|nr:sensor histidine kinase [Bacteroidota bacterium]
MLVKRKQLFILLLNFCIFTNTGIIAQTGNVFKIDVTNKIIQLDKGWHFYWQTTYAQIQADSNHLLQAQPIIVPGSWDKLGLNPHGYGTYTLSIVHEHSKTQQLGLKILNVGTNYNLFIDGKKLASIGFFSNDAGSARPEFRPQIVYFEANSDTINIAMEVSNYSYREGGIWFTPAISNAELIRNNSNRKVILSAFLCGALFVLFGYFIAFYYIKTQDKTSLYFALMCLFACLRLATTGEILFRQYNIPISWEVLVKTEFVSLVMMLLFGTLYLCSMFLRDVNRKVLAVLTTINALVAVFFILSSVNLGSEFIPYYLFFDAFLLFYLLNVIIKIVINKRPYSYYVGFAFLLIFVTGLNDILYSQEIIHTIYMLPAGIFAFAFIQAFTLTRKFSNAFQEVEDLSVQLREINKNQSRDLETRTAQLNIQAEELQKSNLIKDKVFSIIAHDLRAPIKSLSSVLGWVADDDITFEDLKRALNGIRKNVDTLNLTLENLLLWSRSQLQGIKSNPEILDLRSTINDIFELYRIQAREKGILLKSNVLDRTLVFIDKNHLNLLLRNLISNSIKFTNAGGHGEVGISAHYKDNEMVEICVSDNGIGMKPEDADKAFSAIDHHTTYGTSNEKGTGLGLMLCKEYVEENSGRIWLTTEYEKGTKVCFTLPSTE